jgi:CMP-N,N'-diacetyllegionaminic acid synthase
MVGVGYMNSIVALIPARGGSKRLPRKNIKCLGGHPLIAYTIEVARQSKIFDGIYVSTDDLETEAIAQYYGATVIRRPKDLARDDSPDIEWIRHALANIPKSDYFMILRPTNPFREIEMLTMAWDEYEDGLWMKAVQPVSEHPGKMWIVPDEGKYMYNYDIVDSHSLPSQSLSKNVYIQNGSLEIRPSNCPEPEFFKQLFITDDIGGYDINTEKDWIYALHLVTTGKVKLIEIDKKPWMSPA